MTKITISDTSTENEYLNLYQLSVGDVFKVRGNYETVMQRIEDYKPDGVIFEVFPITPGTSLYTMYGPDHCVVTSKD